MVISGQGLLPRCTADRDPLPPSIKAVHCGSHLVRLGKVGVLEWIIVVSAMLWKGWAPEVGGPATMCMYVHIPCLGG